MLGPSSVVSKPAVACSNWAQAPPAVQHWCKHPSRKLAAHVAQPATEAASDSAGQQLQQLSATVAATLLDAQQLLSQQQQQPQQLQPQQQVLLTADSIAAAAVVGGSWPHADDSLQEALSVHGNGTNGASSSNSSSSSSNGSSGYHAAHYSWQADQVQAAEQAELDEQQQQQEQRQVQEQEALNNTAADSSSNGIAAHSSSNSRRSIDVQIDSRGYYTYTAADLQQEQQLPSGPAAAQPPQQPQEQQQQDHMQQLLQQQHQLHQLPQQQLQQPSRHQQQQQVLDRAKAPQRLNSQALQKAQNVREFTNRRLTATIRDAPDLTSLRQIIRQYEGVLNHIQVAALFVRLTKLVSNKQLRPRDILALPSLLPQVLSLVEAAIPDFNERSLSNCIHCMAVLELNQERQLLGSMLAAAENLLRLSRFTPQGLANMTWALGALRLNPNPRLSAQLLAATSSNLWQFPGLELAQFGWGIASMRIRVEEEWLEPWRNAVVRVLPTVTPQGLSMLLWSTARLTESQHMSAVSAVSAAAASSSSSSSSEVPEQVEWLHAAEDTLLQQLPQQTPHSASICLWALGKLGYRPRREVTSAVLDVVEPQLLSSASTQDLAVLLHSLAAFGYRPGKSWVQLHAQALRKKLPQLGVRRISNLLWAHAKLGMKPADDRLLGDMIQVLHGRMPEANTRDLANSLWALATLGHVPQRGFLAAFGAQAQALVHDFSPQEISNLLWAYAKLRVRPPHMLLVALWESVGIGSAASSSGGSSSSSSSGSGGGAWGSSGSSWGSSSGVGARLSAFKPQELAMLVWALAVLKIVPGKAWWDQFLQSSYHKMGSQTPQSLASIIWSLSELQLQPPPAWLYHWAASARGVLDSMNPVDLGQVAAALQGSTFRPLELPKLEALLSDVLDKLTKVETASGAYSKAAVHMLLKIEGAGVQQPGSSSSRGGSRVRRVVLGSSNGSRGVSTSRSGSSQHGLENGAVLLGAGNGPVAAVQHGQGISSDSSSSSSSNNSSSIDGRGVQGRQAEEVAQLKEYLVERSVMDASSSLDDVPDLELEQWSTAAESQ